MAYEVTATRRRPQKFEDLIGQEFVAATLKNSIQSEKIAHAYLFSGPRGCGKTSTARIFAKALNCQNGPTPTPCGECAACREITKGSSLDVIEIDGASNTSVNDVRQIKDEVQFPPNSSRYKVYIIDEVHMLSTSAFNALLKTIEEPPEYVVFIFATTELQKVPATIKSRCQQFNFRLVAIEKIKEQLAAAAAEIGIQADDEALYWIARESTGSMRDAYTLFDQVAAFSENHITYEKIRDKLGLVGTERLNALFEECAAQNVSGVQEKLGDFLQAGISIEQLITNSADYLRSLLLVKNGVTKESLLGQDAARFSQKVLSAWNSVQLERALSIFLQLYRDIRYSLSPRYEIDLAFSRLCWLCEYVSPAEVKQAVDKARALLESPPQNATQAQGGTQQSFSDGAENAQSGAPKEFHFAPLHFSQESNSANLAEENSILQNSNSENSFEQNFSEQDSEKFCSPENSPRQEFAQDAPIDDSLRGKAIAALLVDDEVSASLLKNTKNWRASGETILAEVSDEFQKNQIDAKIQIINKAVSAAFGGNYFFQAQVAAASEQNSQTEIPQVVNTLCKVFKGTILGGIA
ncbi:MAG: DNA polymerase III subunit gamma/tau [Treponemataceae bacterium]|nr:DNA polymerase III subunit gamma/tau [Treponemataceae bacterium]